MSSMPSTLAHIIFKGVVETLIQGMNNRGKASRDNCDINVSLLQASGHHSRIQLNELGMSPTPKGSAQHAVNSVWSILWRPAHPFSLSYGRKHGEDTPLKMTFRGTLVPSAHLCTFCRHLKLARKNSRLVSSPASHPGLTESILLSDFGVVLYSFSFRDNFYLESHSIRRPVCFWHDEKNNKRQKRYSIEKFVRLQ